jgi:uncharacterized protein (DUF1501 family)
MTAAVSVPGLWRRAAAAAGPGPDAPVLVVVELSGGNDGLNTVIPYREDAYHRARPTLRIAPDKVLKLDDALGLHPAMTGLHKLWGDGKVRVLMNVGYPEPSRSHFRSMEIWQSGDLAPSPTTGWLGRASGSTRDHTPPCFVGPGATPLAVQGRGVAPFSLADIESIKLRPGARFHSAPGHDTTSGPAHRVSRAIEAAEAISGRVAAGRPDTPSGERAGLEASLSTICHLIESGVGSRVYYTSLDGFDTHASQAFAHQDLLRKLSEALGRFQSDLAMRRLDERVVVVVFSEFGRRIEENGSKGTDHGAAAPVLLIGPPVAGGLLGGAPNLTDPDEGDVPFTLDFRDVYASLLGDWLRVDPAAVLARDRDVRVELFRS